MTTATDQKHLAAYIQGVNIWAPYTSDKRKFDQKKLPQSDIDYLLEKLDTDLSPENLTCDGELRGATLKAKTAKLLGAQRELKRLSK